MTIPVGPWRAATTRTGHLAHAVRPVMADDGTRLGYACPCGRGPKLHSLGIDWADLDEDVIRCLICSEQAG